MKSKDKMKKPSIGGQAVLEGVMLRSPKYYATSVRTEKGKIVTQLKKIKKRPKWMKLPFIRGIVNLIDMLIIGIKTLNWSANQISDEPEEKLSQGQIIVTLLIAIGFAILLFMALPYFLSSLTGVIEESSPILFNVIDGIIKVIIFLAYLYIISYMKDIRRVFEYHGAEHKVVYCYENGKKLTLQNIKKYSTKHPRCGTSFLFIVIIISIFVFTLIPPIVIALYPSFITLNFWIRRLILFAIRVPFIFPIASISYELLKLSDKYQTNHIIKAISLPGILLQYITTKEPDNKQIEVAVNSMNLLLKKEKINI